MWGIGQAAVGMQFIRRFATYCRTFPFRSLRVNATSLLPRTVDGHEFFERLVAATHVSRVEYLLTGLYVCPLCCTRERGGHPDKVLGCAPRDTSRLGRCVRGSKCLYRCLSAQLCIKHVELTRNGDIRRV